MHRLPPRTPVWDTVSAPHQLTLGLRAIRPEEPWLELDQDLATDLRAKNDLLRDHRDQVFVEISSSRAAQRETLSRVTTTLQQSHPDLYTIDGSSFQVLATGDIFDLDSSTLAPLEIAARCVQEDLVVMEEGPLGWCLTAGSVCFPTRWDLPTKLGRPISEIHARVPGYLEQLDLSSNRFFDGMKPGIVFRRGNWSLMDDPTLFQPVGKLRDDVSSNLDASNAGEKVWLRVEHQTLQRLPETSAILFGIRVHRTRLDAVASEKEVARSLLQAMETMPPDMQFYKSLGMVRSAASKYLRKAIGAQDDD